MKNQILRFLAGSFWKKHNLVVLFTISLCTTYFALNTKAQAPQGIPYQAIARNASGVAIASTAVKVRFSIRDSIATGAIKYQETHNPTTSALGLFSVNVGLGTVVSGTFSGINWGKNAKFLQVELNTTGGTTYTDLGTTQMMSVPYALHANALKMRTSVIGDTLYTGDGNYLIIPWISAANPISTGNGPKISDIDGNLYNTVTIGSQVWMKENLNVSKFKNGDPIPTNLDNNLWGNLGLPSFSGYNNDAANFSIYGKLYNWYAVADQRGLCPTGWHVPSDSEWFTFENFLGGASAAAEKVKSVGTLQAGTGLWNEPNSASNQSGFSGKPAGLRSTQGTFVEIGNYGLWWSSTQYPPLGTGTYYSWYRSVSIYSAGLQRDRTDQRSGISVRCLKD
jgi:uncharacterized protein (TIGR02145 family)